VEQTDYLVQITTQQVCNQTRFFTVRAGKHRLEVLGIKQQLSLGTCARWTTLWIFQSASLFM